MSDTPPDQALVEAIIIHARIQQSLDEGTEEIRAEIMALQGELATMYMGDRETLVEYAGIITGLKQELAANWPSDSKQMEVKGYTLTYKTTKKALILDEIGLVQATKTPKEKAWGYKWDNAKVKKIIEIGLVGDNIARIEERHHIAVTPPKPRDESCGVAEALPPTKEGGK